MEISPEKDRTERGCLCSNEAQRRMGEDMYSGGTEQPVYAELLRTVEASRVGGQSYSVRL